MLSYIHHKFIDISNLVVEGGRVNEFRLSKKNWIGPGFYKIPAVIIKEQRFSLSDDKGNKYPNTD